MALSDLLKSLGGATLNAATSASSGTPNILLNSINNQRAAEQNQLLNALSLEQGRFNLEQARQAVPDNRKARQLKLEQAQFNLDQARDNAPIKRSAQELALEKAGLDVGFMKDKAKRRRALEDAALLQLAADSPEEQKKILRKRILNETKLNPNVDMSDTITALKKLEEDPAAFNRGVARTLRVGQLFGDINFPQDASDNRTTLERNAALAATPGGFEAIQRLTEAQTKPTDSTQNIGAPKQFLVDGQVQLLDRDPKTGEFKDIAGNVIDPSKIQPVPSRSTELTIDKDGNISLQEGRKIPNLTRKSKGELEEKVISNQANLVELERIEEQLDDSFLTFEGKALNKIFEVIDKSKLGKSGLANLKRLPLVGDLVDGLDEENKQFLRDFSSFHANVQKAFSLFGKSISGAAISAQEFDKLQKAYINSGQSPEQFRSVLTEIMTGFKRSNNIVNNLLKQGLDSDSAEGKKKAQDLWNRASGFTIEQRADALEESLKRQGITDPEQVDQVLERMLTDEGF